jgi:hypothetical protein
MELEILQDMLFKAIRHQFLQIQFWQVEELRGYRARIAIASSLKLGKLSMEEVAAIRGQIIFIDQNGEENTKTARIDKEAYIPGLSIYGRTDKDGKFLLLYVPEGSYTLRIEKGIYVKEMDVTVQAGKTLNLSTIQLQTDTISPSTTAPFFSFS